MSRYFVIRQETQDIDTRNTLYEEAQRGRLRQGWGLAGLDLRAGREQWVRSYPIAGARVGWQWPPGQDPQADAAARPAAAIVGEAVVQQLTPPVLEYLRTVRPNQLEQIIEDIFVREGFEVIERNLYDRQGGD